VRIEGVDSTPLAPVGLLPDGSRRDLILVLPDGYETNYVLTNLFATSLLELFSSA